MSQLDFGHLDHFENQLAKTDTKLSHEASLHLFTELTGLGQSHNGNVLSSDDKNGGFDFMITNKDGTQTELDFDKAGDLYQANHYTGGNYSLKGDASQQAGSGGCSGGQDIVTLCSSDSPPSEDRLNKVEDHSNQLKLFVGGANQHKVEDPINQSKQFVGGATPHDGNLIQKP